MAEKRELFVEMRTGRLRPVLRRAVLTSATTPWEGVFLEEHTVADLEEADVAPRNHLIALHLDVPFKVEWKLDDRFQSYCAQPGQLCLVPSMRFSSFRTREGGHTMTVSLEPKFFACVTHELANPERLELVPRHELEDAVLRSVILALHREVTAGHPGGRWYGETLGAVLAAHLARHYCAQRATERIREGGLARAQLRRAIDFIYDHLAEDIPLNALAAATGLSTYHFARKFKQSTGVSPHQYLIQCRVARAKELLLSSEGSTAAIARQLGFCDQSHLTIHFKRVFGVTPKAFRQHVAVRRKA